MNTTWNFINKTTNDKNTSEYITLNMNNKVIQDAYEVAEIFNKNFIRVAQGLAKNILRNISTKE